MTDTWAIVDILKTLDANPLSRTVYFIIVLAILHVRYLLMYLHTHSHLPIHLRNRGFGRP